jgi:hypothetical protein
MGTDRHSKRIEKIESSLMPREMVTLWVEDVAKFDSFEDYALWVAEDSSRAPLPKMFQQIESSILGLPAGGGKRFSDKNPSRELLRQRSSEVLFLFHLILQVNQQAHDLLGQKEFRVAAIEAGVQAIKERVCSGMAMFELWKGLADTPYPLDADIAAAVSWALKNEVTGIDDLALAIADWQSNHFADRVANEQALSETCERVKRAIHDLCRSGLVKRGSCVTLDPTPIGVLSEPPLVDGVWIDRVAVELAEFAATLYERGIKFKRPADPHPLAPLQARRSKEIPGDQEAAIPSEGEIADARAEAAVRLAGFAGRSREIDARPYIHLDDYRAWRGRKAGDDLEVTEGVVTASWNAWVEASSDKPELAGIQVGKLDPCPKEEDFFSCENLERRRGREKRVSLMASLIIDSKGVSELELGLQASRVRICRLLSEALAIATAAERLTARYLPGVKILFKPYSDALNDLNASAKRLADDYNELADYIETNAGRIIFGTGFAGRIERIDKNTADQVAEGRVESLCSKLVAFAKAQMLSAFDENDKATEILKPFVRGRGGPAPAVRLNIT